MAVAMMVDIPEGTQEIYEAVVTPSGPTALLVTSASVQVAVGAVMLRRSGRPSGRARPSSAGPSRSSSSPHSPRSATSGRSRLARPRRSSLWARRARPRPASSEPSS